MHPLTLRFGDPVEREFFTDYVRGSRAQVRAAFVLAAALAVAVEVFLVVRGNYVVTAGALARWGTILLFAAIAATTHATWFGRVMGVVVGSGLLWFGLFQVVQMVLAPSNDSISFGFVALILLTFYAFVFSRVGFVNANLVAWTVMAAFAVGASAVRHRLPNAPTGFIIWGTIAYAAAAAAGYFTERYVRRDFVQRGLIGAERARSERLLLNVLPPVIAERLKAGESPIADAYTDVTALFADIVDFTPMSARCSPRQMVETLNAVFTEFDRLASGHGLEKIKTVGDAYMVVGGAPNPRPDHTEAVAELALDMQRAIAGRTTPTGDVLRLRVGINTGPAVAAVIGESKFQYDLWGDAVNTAARMESHGVPGAIQVTEAVYERLKDRYALQERGHIDVKGKGPMRVYLLTGRCDDAEGSRGTEPAAAR